MKGYLPVMDTFGFETDLRVATSGLAFPQTVGVKREYEDRCSHIGRLFLEILWTSQ